MPKGIYPRHRTIKSPPKPRPSSLKAIKKAVAKLPPERIKGICPLCNKSSPNNEVHSECSDREQYLADRGN